MGIFDINVRRLIVRLISFCHCRVKDKNGRIYSREAVLGNHHRKSPQRWMELRLYGDYG